MTVAFCLFCLLGMSAPADEPKASGRADSAQAQASRSPPEAQRDELDQLQWCLEGILDEAGRPDERRRWAKRLLLLGSPQTRDEVVALLNLSETPEAQRAVCEALASGAHEHPEWLDIGFVEPLIRLLGAQPEGLRAAAAGALAGFPGPDVPARLGAVAATPDLALIKRLAAVDALAVNTHRRDVVGHLVRLLDSGVPEMMERVLTALQAASREPFDSNPDRCRAWWYRKSRLTEEAWLADQVHMYRDRLRALTVAFHAERRAAGQRHAELTSRLSGFQSELFRALGPERQDEKLAEWLDDPMEQVELAALSKIKARIADEGKRPEGPVLEALLRLLRQGTTVVRREVLLIAQNLGDQAIVDAVLARLPLERDATTRLAIFRALGRFRSPQAIPALIAEIASEQSEAACVGEAAIALGLVAEKASDAPLTDDHVAAVKARYAAVPADCPPATTEHAELRAALLQAMAGVGNAAFLGEFRAALECDDASLLKPAMQGLRALGDTSKLPRLRALTAHTDSGVRLAAIAAIGPLGGENADVESLLSRLNPTIETSEPARDAAWHAFRSLLSRKSIEDRITAAQRLRDLNDLQVRYLQELADELAAANGNAAGLEALRDRLGSLLVAHGQHARAVPQLEALYRTLSARGDAGALDCGLRLLDATLRCGTYQAAADLIASLIEGATGTEAQVRITATVERFASGVGLDPPHSAELLADREGAAQLLDALRTVPADRFGERWTRLLQALTDRLEPTGNE